MDFAKNNFVSFFFRIQIKRKCYEENNKNKANKGEMNLLGNSHDVVKFVDKSRYK